MNVPDVEIKYINDIFMQGSKVAGNLTQAELLPKNVIKLLIGIGVNLNTQ